MNSDEDALSWAGDREDRAPNLRASSASSAKKKSAKAEVEPSPEPALTPEPVATPESTSPTKPTESKPQPTFDEIIGTPPEQQLPAWVLVVYGLFAGVYLLFSVAWLIIALNPPVSIKDPLGSFMWVGSLWFITLGGVVWFGATFLLGRDRSIGWRLLMLLVGALVLIPWPYLTLVVR